ncbi:MAG: DUF3179 domain-containing (seleno)protein [Isosphaeraceae bacterium]
METLGRLPVRPFRAKGTALVLLALGLAVSVGLVLSVEVAPPRSRPQPIASPVTKPLDIPANRIRDPALPPIETIFNLKDLTIPLDKILRGLQPKDGFKALTNPSASPVAEASFLEPGSRVVGLTVDGVSRAYPINVLNWHELINDHLGHTELAITYCSLCDSVTVFDRRLDGQVFEFGVSGMVYLSNMLFFDRTDQALWSQMTSTAISGPHAGRTLRRIDGWEMTTFGAWRASHPDSTVVNFQTGRDHAYSSDPHRAYFETETLDSRYQDLATDARLRNKARIIGVRYGGEARAYPIEALKAAGRATILDRIGGEPVELAVEPATGAVRVVRVPETGLVIHTLWFAWVARFPETEIYQPAGDTPGKR